MWVVADDPALTHPGGWVGCCTSLPLAGTYSTTCVSTGCVGRVKPSLTGNDVQSLLLGTSQGVRWSSGELPDTTSSEICRTLIVAVGTRQAFSRCIERPMEEGRLCVVPPREKDILKQDADVLMQGIITDQVCSTSQVLRDEGNPSDHHHARTST